MIMCAGKNRMWLGVQIVDVKCKSEFIFFSIKRNTTICSWYKLKVMATIAKFCLVGEKIEPVTCLCPGMRILSAKREKGGAWQTSYIIVNVLPRTEENELFSYLSRTSLSVLAITFKATTFPRILFAKKFLFLINLFKEEFPEKRLIFSISNRLALC